MKEYAVIILDCGATNVRAVAINQAGKIKAIKSFRNNTADDPFLAGGRIWDVNEIRRKLYAAIRDVLGQISDLEPVGVAITTFGVDGAPFDKTGKQLFPVISWACRRTIPVMENINKYISLQALYQMSGVYQFGFNTIYKLIWLGENHPGILQQTENWLFMPSILSYHLTGEMYTDVSMAGTSMLTDLKTRDFSDEILEAIHISKEIFPPVKEAGTKIGSITKEGSIASGLPEGLPVFAAGHDTQFAIFGSGAGVNEPVLSSGTWEILMVRTPKIDPNPEALNAGITTEFDAATGLYNPGLQWLGSGILEWIRKNFYADKQNDPGIYHQMIAEAEKFDKTEIKILPDFLSSNGQILNLNINTHRGEIYRAMLNALAEKTKTCLALLEQNCGFKAKSLIVVGGGSKNKLWNKIREEVIGLPVRTISQTETTVSGAAMFAFAGCGIFRSVEEVRKVFLSR
jgi:L-fuculokinase